MSSITFGMCIEYTTGSTPPVAVMKSSESDLDSIIPICLNKTYGKFDGNTLRASLQCNSHCWLRVVISINGSTLNARILGYRDCNLCRNSCISRWFNVNGCLKTKAENRAYETGASLLCARDQHAAPRIPSICLA